jgi:hypothetical protein
MFSDLVYLRLRSHEAAATGSEKHNSAICMLLSSDEPMMHEPMVM